MSNRATAFKLTYSTMFDPPPELHRHFEEALARVKAHLGGEYPMWIAGEARQAAEQFDAHSPINRNWLLGRFQRGTDADAGDAVAAAKRAWPAWAGMREAADPAARTAVKP